MNQIMDKLLCNFIPTSYIMSMSKLSGMPWMYGKESVPIVNNSAAKKPVIKPKEYACALCCKQFNE